MPLRAADADGHVLLASAIRRQEYTAELWTLDGDLVCQGDFGNALRHVLATTGGAIWVGYFDEALGGSGPQGHGVARFSSGLVPEWLYPIGSSLPPVFDCYALNVVGRDAYVQAYDEFHLVRVNGDDATDLGRVPRQGANRVLVDDNRAALIGGYGAEYDLITPIRLTREGIKEAGEPCWLVLPDGLEFRGARTTCRGTTMHAVIGRQKYRIELDDLRFWD